MTTAAGTKTLPDFESKMGSAIASCPKRRLIMSLGDKGGTSKSFIVRKIAELHLAAKTPGLMLVDGDRTVGSLFKYHGEREADGTAITIQSERGVQVFGLHGELDARDKFVNDLLRRGAELVITDLPATSLTKLREISAEYDFARAVADAGYRLTIIAPITPYDDSVLDLQEAIALLDPAAFRVFERLFDANATPADYTAARASITPRADYVGIVNLGLAEDRQDFTIWDAGDSFTRQLLAFVSGVELELPRLRAAIRKYGRGDRGRFRTARPGDRRIRAPGCKAREIRHQRGAAVSRRPRAPLLSIQYHPPRNR